MCHTPEQYVEYFKLLKRVLPPNRIHYDFVLKMDGGWCRLVRHKNLVLTGAKLNLSIAGKPVEYVDDVKYDMNISVTRYSKDED